MALPSSSMITKRTTAALFTIAMACSLIVVSGGFVGSVYAYAHTAKKVKQHQYTLTLPLPFSGLPTVLHKDKSVSRTSQSVDTGNSGWTVIDANSIPTEEMYMWRYECNT